MGEDLGSQYSHHHQEVLVQTSGFLDHTFSSTGVIPLETQGVPERGRGSSSFRL